VKLYVDDLTLTTTSTSIVGEGERKKNKISPNIIDPADCASIGEQDLCCITPYCLFCAHLFFTQPMHVKEATNFM